jgi:hypothetical protein
MKNRSSSAAKQCSKIFAFFAKPNIVYAILSSMCFEQVYD